jgi:hypothetical protein
MTRTLFIGDDRLNLLARAGFVLDVVAKIAS